MSGRRQPDRRRIAGAVDWGDPFVIEALGWAEAGFTRVEGADEMGMSPSALRRALQAARVTWEGLAAARGPMHRAPLIEAATRGRKRPCITGCGATILSQGPHHRMCDGCAESGPGRAGHEYSIRLRERVA